MQRHLGALSVRVQLSAGATEAEIDDAIADAIVRALRREGKLLKEPALTLLPPGGEDRDGGVMLSYGICRKITVSGF